MKTIRYITSDCNAVSIIHDLQGYAKSPEDAVADVLRAGIVGPNPIVIFPCFTLCDIIITIIIIIIIVVLLNLGL